jgi:hypothetical protein
MVGMTIDITAEPWLDKKELAAALGVNPGTINKWCRVYPDFPALRLPGLNRYRKSDVAAWLINFKRTTEKRKAMHVTAA